MFKNRFVNPLRESQLLVSIPPSLRHQKWWCENAAPQNTLTKDNGDVPVTKKAHRDRRRKTTSPTRKRWDEQTRTTGNRRATTKTARSAPPQKNVVSILIFPVRVRSESATSCGARRYGARSPKPSRLPPQIRPPPDGEHTKEAYDRL